MGGQAPLNPETRLAFAEKNKSDQDKIRERYLARRSEVALLTIDEARQRRPDLQWSTNEKPARPSFMGVRVLDDFPLTALVPFIDWSPLFHAWQLKGTYPRIFEDKVTGEKARELFQDAWQMLEKMVAERWLHARGVYGFWPANSAATTFNFLARIADSLWLRFTRCGSRLRADSEFNYAMADFVV